MLTVFRKGADVQGDEEVLTALEALEDALQDNIQRNQRILERIAEKKRQHADGRSWRDIVSEGTRPLVVEMLSQNMAVLTTAGAQVRRSEARALHAEGMSMEKIAALFGVSRQRISELLRQGDDAAPDETL